MSRNLPTGVYTSGKSHYQFRILLPADASGKRRSEVRGGFLTPEDASLARSLRMRAVGLQPTEAIGLDRQPLRDYLDAYLISHALQVDPSTIYNYRQRLTYITPYLGDVPLRDLTPARVRAWLATLTAKVSASTAGAARGLLVQALHQAVRDEILPRNVASLVRAPRHQSKAPVILAPTDIGAFLRAADADRLQALWYLGLLVQLRPGELAGLRWSDIDLDSGVLTVRVTRTRNERGRFVLGDGTKTVSSQRVIELPALCVRLLKEHRRRQVAVILSAPPGVFHDQGLVFPNRTGGVLSNSTIEYRLRKVCQAAGVTADLTPHGLRHSGATWQRSLGIAPEVVQRRLGHKHVTMTLEVYSHRVEGEQQAASDTLETALEQLKRTG